MQSKIMGRRLKILFLTTATVVIICASIMITFIDDDRYRMNDICILLTFFFVLLYSALLIWCTYLISSWLHERAIKKLQYEINENSFDLPQTRNLVVSLPYDEAYMICKKCSEIKDLHITHDNFDQGEIEGTFISYRAGGKMLANYEIKQINDKKTRIIILCKPVNRIPPFDYGESLEYVETTVAYINELSSLRERVLSLQITNQDSER